MSFKRRAQWNMRGKRTRTNGLQIGSSVPLEQIYATKMHYYNFLIVFYIKMICVSNPHKAKRQSSDSVPCGRWDENDNGLLCKSFTIDFEKLLDIIATKKSTPPPLCSRWVYFCLPTQ
jgi:hypothetical protein